MEHLTEEKMTAVVFGGADWSTQEAGHIENCSACQARISALNALADELSIAKQSAVSPEAEARYLAAFEQRPQGGESLWSQVGEWLRAMIVFDSRNAAPAAGMRSAAANSGYRVLYAAGEAEVELMVEPEAETRRLEGEYFGLDDDAQGPVLIHLMELGGQGRVYETESMGGDRFRFANVAPGRYQMTLSTANDEVISIEMLEIT